MNPLPLALALLMVTALGVATNGKYYVIRANALEKNFRLYSYDRGRRQLASASVQPPPLGQWHEFHGDCHSRLPEPFPLFVAPHSPWTAFSEQVGSVRQHDSR